MHKISVIQNNRTSIPAPVKRFLIRSLIIFILWKLIYLLVLLPSGIPDKQLTVLTAKATSIFFNAIHQSTSAFTEINNKGGHETVFFINGQRAIGIADRCNALELMVLYAAFLFCIPTNVKRQFTYAIAGIVCIFILNILRCYALAILNLNHYPVADFAHHYIFTTIIYGLIFTAWVYYSKPYFKND